MRPNVGPDAIIPAMVQKILLEIAILALSLSVFPALVLALLIYTGSIRDGLTFLMDKALATDWGPYSTALGIWIKFFSPYLVVQAARAYFWAQRSLTGRRWANAYFSLLALLVGVRSLWRAWDMFYFMYALGDIPSELGQFLQLEAVNLVIAAAGLALFVHCLITAINPVRGKPA